MASEFIRQRLEAIGGLIVNAFNAARAYFFERRIMTYNDLMSLDNNLTPQIQDLLKHVYAVLFVAAFAAALGTKLDLPFQFGGLIILPVPILCFIWCRYCPQPQSRWANVLLLLATAFSVGASIRSFAHGTKFSKGFMIFVEAACAIFISFIAGATTPRRIDMYAIAVPPSILRSVSWLIIPSDSHPLDYLQIYSMIASLVLLLYVAVYSQDLVAQARAQPGHVLNFAQHAVYFFSDILAIIFHIVVIYFWRSFRRGNGGNGAGGGGGGNGGNGGRRTHPRRHPIEENRNEV